CFQISRQRVILITTFAGFLCDKIEPALRQAVYERTAKAIAEDMQGKFPDFQGSRSNLEVCILRYLAEQENFEDFKQYLKFPKDFFQTYIDTRVQSHCLDARVRLERFLYSSLNLLFKKILSAVSLSTQIVKDRKDREEKISLWLDEFCRELTEVISLPRSDLKCIEHREVTDIDILSRVMAEALGDMRDRLVKEFADADMSSFSTQPQMVLAEHFSECWTHCPFCGAVLSVVFHQTQAFLGDTWWRCSPGIDYNTHTLMLAICSSLVARDCKFIFGRGPWISHGSYHNAGPPFSTWTILPDSSMQAYWKWFVSHFRTQLE
ncbi:GVIN1 GTPase, partial [Erythrocercus mccallii]|nr:GVIN1 GTPase [Erythrocercus mccallii]